MYTIFFTFNFLTYLQFFFFYNYILIKNQIIKSLIIQLVITFAYSSNETFKIQISSLPIIEYIYIYIKHSRYVAGNVTYKYGRNVEYALLQSHTYQFFISLKNGKSLTAYASWLNESRRSWQNKSSTVSNLSRPFSQLSKKKVEAES